MITVLGEHTIDSGLLPDRPAILDVGCRWFDFGDAIRCLRPTAVIHELDIDVLNTTRPYTRAAIAHYDGTANCSQDPHLASRHIVSGTGVPVYTIGSFSVLAGVQKWDVLKLDCEGSEYDILKSFDRAWAAQVTVEFHQHTQFRRAWDEIDAIIDQLCQWYTVVQHRIESRSGMGPNYWDTLLIAK